MNYEQKELLLKDLCARLPHGVKVEYNSIACEVLSIDRFHEELTIWICPGYYPDVKLEDVKPYLFPLSSMTEEQKEEHQDLINNHYHFDANGNVFTLQDFYCKYHFDYRGLIPMDLANDATGLNIY